MRQSIIYSSSRLTAYVLVISENAEASTEIPGYWQCQTNSLTEQVGKQPLCPDDMDHLLNLTLLIFALLCVSARGSSIQGGNTPCPPITPNEHASVTCSFGDDPRPCRNASMPPDTRAVFTCNRYYTPAGGKNEKFCLSTGNWSDWDTEDLTCQLNCGQSFVSQTQFIISGGEKAVNKQWPWHVSIYKSIAGDYVYWCGGTLVEQDVVVTAAHCMTRHGSAQPENPELFWIKLGKSKKSFYSVDRQAQNRQVKKFFVHEQFLENEETPFMHNIAVVFLNRPVSLRQQVFPVCSSYRSGTAPASNFKVGRIGSVPVWQKDTTVAGSSAEEEIHSLRLPFIPYSECAYEFEQEVRDTLFESNFCAGFYNESTLCEEDAGSGMVFMHIQSNGIPQWHLEGTVNSPFLVQEVNGNCFKNVTVFTRTDTYKTWILETIDRERNGGSSTANTNCSYPQTSPNAFVECFDAGNKPVPCSDAMPVKSRAQFKCQNYYTAVGGINEKFCLPGGQWSNSDVSSLVCEYDCGRSYVSETPAIVSGVESKVNQWPWHAALYHQVTIDSITGATSWEYNCGATLIDVDVILTAAHCVTVDKTSTPLPITDLKIALGKHFSRLDENEALAQVFKIKYMIVHEQYKKENVLSFDHDMALLFLERPVVLTVAVQPVCSPHKYLFDSDSHLQDGQYGWVPGWGFTRIQAASSTLQMTPLPFVSSAICEDKLPTDKKKKIPDGQFCAGYFRPENDTNVCSGDSGGGMVFQEKRSQKWFLEGVVSSSIKQEGMCFTQVAFFAKVARYKLWMIKNIEMARSIFEKRNWCRPFLKERRTDVRCQVAWNVTAGRSPEYEENFWNGIRNGEIHGYSIFRTEENDCDEWMPSGTMVYLSCKQGYKSLTENNLVAHACLPEGKWGEYKMEADYLNDMVCLPRGCGEQNPESPDVWPWHASIYICERNSTLCKLTSFGTLITSRIILTDYYTTYWEDDGDLKVVLGQLNKVASVLHKNETTDLRDVTELLSYKNPYKVLEQKIGVLILASDVNITENVHSACFEEYSLEVGSTGVLLGKKPGSQQLMRQKNELTVVDTNICNYRNISTTYKCAPLMNESEEAYCIATVGSGLVQRFNTRFGDNKWHLLGILSKAEYPSRRQEYKCVEEYYKYIFIRLASYWSQLTETITDVHGVHIEP